MPHFRTLTEISFELSRRLLPLYRQGPIFWLAQNDREAAKLLALCRYFDASFPDSCISSPDSLSERTVSAEKYKHHTLKLKAGLKLPLTDLTATLQRLNFERYPRAVADRTFAVRGQIIDIVDRVPIRLEYDGNTISSLRRFNPSTQHSEDPVGSALIWPNWYAPHLPLWQENNLTYEFVTPKYYHKRFSLLQHDAEQFLHIRVATAHQPEVHTLLPQAIITPLLRGGFLTDEHIFGEEIAPQTFGQALDPKELAQGDYLVHIDHGIGVFDRLTTIKDEPYIVLRYLHNDKLSVPVAMANRLEKYVGAATPKLTSLSGTHWEQIVQRVQEDIRHTAQELLRLYASRSTALAQPIALTETADERACAADADFELTPDQTQAISDIENDLQQQQPMDRLLCGDVGFGKTEVALRATLHVIINGAAAQVALIAPTTVLAEQHARTFTKRLERFGVVVKLLSRLQTSAEQKKIVAELAAGKVDCVIGTHRLLSADVTIPNLALVIIDEEQRFGVLHKERLKHLRASAHVLTMTATPIPRTLNLALSGLRDISVLNTAPPQRQGVVSVIEPFAAEVEVQAIGEELARRGQVYLVHNTIGTLYARERFLAQYFSQARLGIAHGQLPASELVRVMRQFSSGEIDVLIASTIIENGLDITNANTLIVEHAEQYGLAQLYQLRGRIGRGQRQAYAYFLYATDRLTKAGQERLRALRRAKALGGGFELAMNDLEIRGVGDILGKKQHGHVQQIGLNLYNRLLHQAIEQLRELNNQSKTSR